MVNSWTVVFGIKEAYLCYRHTITDRSNGSPNENVVRKRCMLPSHDTGVPYTVCYMKDTTCSWQLPTHSMLHEWYHVQLTTAYTLPFFAIRIVLAAVLITRLWSLCCWHWLHAVNLQIISYTQYAAWMMPRAADNSPHAALVRHPYHVCFWLGH